LIEILHLEDCPADAELARAKLEEAGLVCRIILAQTEDEFKAGLGNDGTDIILADLQLPDYDGISALHLAKERRPDVPFLFVSGKLSETAAIDAITQGATDYVLKHDLSRLAPAVQRALQGARMNRRAREALQRNDMINAARRHLLQFAASHSLDELLEETLNEVERITGSLIGFFHFVDDDQQALTRQNWSVRAKERFCKAGEKGLHNKMAGDGAWMDCVQRRNPVIHNDCKSLPYRSGWPGGHAEVVRELAVPVIRGEKIKAILGVGNKPGDYTEEDAEALILLADLAWEVTERKLVERQIAMMSFTLDGIHDAALMIDENACFQYVNDEACRLLEYTRSELSTMSLPDIYPKFSTKRWLAHWDDLKQHGTLTFERTFKTRNGRLFPVEIDANYFEYEGKSYDLGLIRDITERKEAERERLANLRFFENMDKVNRAIQGANDLEDMMKDLLDVVISIFDCDRAFLMYPCDPESATWSVPMERNKPEHPGVRDLKLELPMDPQYAEKLRILLAADGPVAFGPGTDHEQPSNVSKQFNIKSNMAMAIYPRTGSPWQFGMHQCTSARHWTAEEMRMFEAIGRRLADGLNSLLSYRDLRENEAFLDKVVEHIPNMIFVKDAQTLSFVRFNKAGERLLGWSRKELLGKTDYDFFHKEEADFFTGKDRQVLASKELVDIPEETIRTRGDEERILHTIKIPILDQTGVPQYLLGISEDITERKKAEESIRKLSQAIEQSPVSIVITDLGGRIEFVNAKFTQITGYAYDEAIGKNPRILKSGETPEEEYRLLWQAMESGDVWQGEFQNRKKNGELFWEQATIAPVRNADNVITHYVAVKEDVTERKRLEEQLRQTQKMEAVGQLAGGVAHDFNNMLSVIIGHAELALGGADLNDSLRKNLQEILTAGLRSSDITRQLLGFARKQTIVPKILDLNEAVEGMLKLLRRLIGEDIDLAWMPGAKLWPVKMDPSQIDQVLANLCVNARDAIAGVGRISIETQSAVLDDAYCAEHRGFIPGEFVMLTVSDDGSGMDKAIMEKIFEPFFTTKGVGKGTGLGLATVYGIVKQNQGFINVYSEPGSGTTFKIYLPRHETPSSREPEPDPEPQELWGQETILVVEDEVLNLELVGMMLKHFGYQVLVASSPSEALIAAERHTDQIHLLLTDLIMPEMNGWDLSKELISLYPDIKCLFMSGYTNDIIVHQGILEPGIHFLQKPFSMQRMAAKVREVLDAG
jgi:PAS domain S-box-containing protein